MHSSPKRRPWFPRGPWLWGSAIVFVLLGAFILWQVPGPLLDHWVDPSDDDEQRKLLGSAAQIVLLSLGGVIAVVGVALSIARHGQSLEAAEFETQRQQFEEERESTRRAEFVEQQQLESRRERSRLSEVRDQRISDHEQVLRARFVTAVDLLSAGERIKRIAGLYALASVADAWVVARRHDEVQVCIDVLCGYLRAASPADPVDRGVEAGVRRTGFDLIRAHLTTTAQDGPGLWTGHRFSLAGAPIWYDVDLSGVECAEETEVDLSGSIIWDAAAVHFLRATVRDQATISFASVRLREQGKLLMLRARVRDNGRLLFSSALIASTGALSLEELDMTGDAFMELTQTHVEEDGTLNLAGAIIEDRAVVRGYFLEVRGAGTISLERAAIRGEARVDFSHASLAGGASMHLAALHLEGGLVDFSAVRVETDSRISMNTAQLTSPGRIDFSDAVIRSGGAISLSSTILGAGTLAPPHGPPVPHTSTKTSSTSRLTADGFS